MIQAVARPDPLQEAIERIVRDAGPRIEAGRMVEHQLAMQVAPGAFEQPLVFADQVELSSQPVSVRRISCAFATAILRHRNDRGTTAQMGLSLKSGCTFEACPRSQACFPPGTPES